MVGRVLWTLLLAACYFVQARQQHENASKKDNTDKGILTSNPFLDAVHFWPFETIRSNVITMDIVTGRNAVALEGANLVFDSEFQDVISTEKNNSYIIAGDFKDTCFSDPDKCIMGGMTITIWIKLNDSLITKGQDAYIISSGGQSKKSRGFAFLYFHGKYVVCLSTEHAQWKMSIPKLKTGVWNNVLFVWRKGEYLSYYLNGEYVCRVNSTAASRPEVKYTILTIGRPNNALNSEFMYPMRIADLALWDKPLKKDQIKLVYTNIQGIHENPDLGKKKRRSHILQEEFARKREMNKRGKKKNHKRQ